jgi:hypothetical protein
MVVTKPERCALAACGRLGDGRALPVHIVFGSGGTYDPAWALDIKTFDILDNNGEPWAWRDPCNTKVSVNEEVCADYVENVLRPALGYPLPRATHPGEQGFVVCDGMGSHLCFPVVEKDIEFGMEILLRVPNLNYILQGEDTNTFKVSTIVVY